MTDTERLAALLHDEVCLITCSLCHQRIQSRYRHDWVLCKCGETFVDGEKRPARAETPGHPHNSTPDVELSKRARAETPGLDEERLRLVLHREYEQNLTRWQGCEHRNQHRSTWDCAIRAIELSTALEGEQP